MKVLITRPEDDARVLAEEIKARGLEPVMAPLLEIVASPAALPDLDDYDALAFTSAAAVRIFAHKTLQRGLKCFVVGPNTKNQAEKAGFENIYCADGNALELFNLIVRHKPKRILYCAGKDKAEPLCETLNEAGIVCDEDDVYEARAVESLPPDVVHLIEEQAIDIALFYSARTAAIFVALAEQSGVKGKLKAIKALCLSGRVLESAHAILWKRTCVCEAPDGGSMMALLDQILNDKGEESYYYA